MDVGILVHGVECKASQPLPYSGWYQKVTGKLFPLYSGGTNFKQTGTTERARKACNERERDREIDKNHIESFDVKNQLQKNKSRKQYDLSSSERYIQNPRVAKEAQDMRRDVPPGT